MKKILSLLCALSLLLTASCAKKPEPAKEEPGEPKLLLTIACLSDLHNQDDLITSDPPRLREDIGTVLTAMKQEETKVDVLLIGGDVTSDKTTSQGQVHGILDQLKSYTDPLTKNVLFVSGNHDYNAGYESGYNSADYYDYRMKADVGELAGDDAYYEFLLGGNYLLGYHYVIGGFDFIGISPSPADLKANQNYYYQYTDGTLSWLERTLARLGSGKTVFLFGHFPFADSYSLNSGKGMLPDCNARMLSICKNYPHLFYFYGHDHAGDSAYLHTDTAQRVTRYASDGTVVGGGDELDRFDDRSVWTFEATTGGVAIRSAANGKYLSLDGEIGLSDTPYPFTAEVTDKGVKLRSAATGEGIYHSEGVGGFTKNTGATPLLLYRRTLSGYEKTTEILDRESYVLVSRGHKETVALSNRLTPSNRPRMDGLTVSLAENTIVHPGEAPLPEGEAGFTTSFMGSMRYYSNSFDGMIGAKTPAVVQALLIYVYEDRVVLQMKNYGEKDGGMRELASFTVPRTAAEAEARKAA